MHQLKCISIEKLVHTRNKYFLYVLYLQRSYYYQKITTLNEKQVFLWNFKLEFLQISRANTKIGYFCPDSLYSNAKMIHNKQAMKEKPMMIDS